MERNPRYDILFEPVRIGPVTAPNRFYQTPHAVGMGYLKPQASAALRGVKAEGGWGVVCTEYCSIHPTSDDTPYGFLTLWDDDDVKALALTADAIHAHGSLAGIELWHGGSHASNRMTRQAVLAPSSKPAKYQLPVTARRMDRQDIRDFRNWQKLAALRAKSAGFDIIYVYGGHDYLPFQFLSGRHNDRTDEYGGSLENRVRLLREMIEDTRDAVGDSCAVALRLAVDELHGPTGITSEGEGREAVAMLANLPDLWDVNVAGSLGNDSKSARFSAEGFQEPYVSFVKSLTDKPVVSVGRFTSPDAMVSQIKRGIQDFIGAARPSIADPFLPAKIRDGREDDIRECIGCNICRAANNEAVTIRCTQNPTMGEEWRRGWHPEKIEASHDAAKVLVIGGGPSGLEAARALGHRGYDVTLADAHRQMGGRLLNESRLPGLSTWIRVRDYRVRQLQAMPNVSLFNESHMTAEDIIQFGADHVVLASGSHWRRDGIGVVNETPAAFPLAVTPDDIFAGKPVSGPVVIYDDDHYFMAGALAEKLKSEGHDVTLVSAMPVVSSWTAMTDEQYFIQKKLMDIGVRLVLSQIATNQSDDGLELSCAYTGALQNIACGTLVLVTGRLADTHLFDELSGIDPASHGLKSIERIGDCLAPSSIADAIYSGHQYARMLGKPERNPLLARERPSPGDRRHG